MKKDEEKPRKKAASKRKGKQTSKDTKKEWKSAYEVVTERFIEFIEKNGTLPWRKPWMVTQPESPPMNFITKKPYQGVNMMLCLMSGYSSPYWMTFKQAAELGGYAKKGEKGIKVVKYEPPNKAKLKEIDEDSTLDDEEKEREKWKYRGYYTIAGTIFNAEQIEGIEFPEPEKPKETKKFVPIKKAEALIKKMSKKLPTVTRNEDRAYYNREQDRVNIPKVFESANDYYSTLFHEFAHSTGHASRLDRFSMVNINRFGDRDYSFEELVAELSSSFVMNELGIENTETSRNSAAYLAGWCKTMKADAKMLLKAMAKAIPATEYIFGRHDSLKGETT